MADASKLFVTGAAGQLGVGVIDALLETTPADVILAGVRDPQAEGARRLREKGVELRLADYTRPETLDAAFAGVGRLLLISSSENGRRKAQHRNVVAAAKDADVGFIAYTSILHADTSPLLLAEEHRDTEAALVESGVPHALLRNGWYTEVYTWRLPLAFRTGVLMGAAGAGRISAAARSDYARAAATVLAGGDHDGEVYELAGDAAFTLTEWATAAAELSGRPLDYRNMSEAQLREVLLEAGLPEPAARIVSDTDAGVAEGALLENGGALARLIGRATTPFRATLANHLGRETRG